VLVAGGGAEIVVVDGENFAALLAFFVDDVDAGFLTEARIRQKRFVTNSISLVLICLRAASP
jgi:hypothetical protein